MADDWTDAVRARAEYVPHDDELLSRVGRAAHRARVRLLRGNRLARLDLETRWAPVLTTDHPANEDAPLIDPERPRSTGDGDLNYTVY